VFGRGVLGARPFGFAGQHGYQTDTDTGLMRLGHRYYDSSTGRFISRDPIRDGYNWYTYCSNNPVNAIDPQGLAGIDPPRFLPIDPPQQTLPTPRVSPPLKEGEADVRGGTEGIPQIRPVVPDKPDNGKGSGLVVGGKVEGSGHLGPDGAGLNFKGEFYGEGPLFGERGSGFVGGGSQFDPRGGLKNRGFAGVGLQSLGV
jgi:RHS repeat-associated protein